MRRLPRDYMDNTSKSCNWVRASYRLQDALKPGVNDSGQHPLTSHVCYRSRSQVARGAALGHLPTPRPPSSGNGWPALCSQHLPQWLPCPVLRLQCATCGYVDTQAQPVVHARAIFWLGPTQCATPQYCNSRSGGFRKHATLATCHCPGTMRFKLHFVKESAAC